MHEPYWDLSPTESHSMTGRWLQSMIIVDCQLDLPSLQSESMNEISLCPLFDFHMVMRIVDEACEDHSIMEFPCLLSIVYLHSIAQNWSLQGGLINDFLLSQYCTDITSILPSNNRLNPFHIRAHLDGTGESLDISLKFSLRAFAANPCTNSRPIKKTAKGFILANGFWPAGKHQSQRRQIFRWEWNRINLIGILPSNRVPN